MHRNDIGVLFIFNFVTYLAFSPKYHVGIMVIQQSKDASTFITMIPVMFFYEAIRLTNFF